MKDIAQEIGAENANEKRAKNPYHTQVYPKGWDVTCPPVVPRS